MVELTNLKKKSELIYQLKTIKGIGKKTASKLCNTIGIGKCYNLNTINNTQKYYIKLYINNKCIIEKDLDQKISKNIQKYKSNNSFRGLCHKLGYPVRGQKTRTNGKTAKRLNKIRR